MYLLVLHLSYWVFTCTVVIIKGFQCCYRVLFVLHIMGKAAEDDEPSIAGQNTIKGRTHGEGTQDIQENRS